MATLAVKSLSFDLILVLTSAVALRFYCQPSSQRPFDEKATAGWWSRNTAEYRDRSVGQRSARGTGGGRGSGEEWELDLLGILPHPGSASVSDAKSSCHSEWAASDSGGGDIGSSGVTDTHADVQHIHQSLKDIEVALRVLTVNLNGPERHDRESIATLGLT